MYDALVDCPCLRCMIVLGELAVSEQPFGHQGLIEEVPFGAVVAAAELGRVCSWCFAMPDEVNAKLQKCSRCHVNAYCNAKCQALDWDHAHKLECRLYRRNPKAVPAAKAHVLVRLVVRMLIRLQLEKEMADAATPKDSSFYGKPSRTVWDLEPNLVRQFLQTGHYRREYHCFKGSFYQLVGERGESLGFDVGETELPCSFQDAVERIYMVICQYAFPIVDVGCGHFGQRTLGLGLYLNFSQFSHSCSPSLSTNFAPSMRGPLMKARRQPAICAKPYIFSLELDEHTISRFDLMSTIQECGTLVPYQEEIDEYLRCEWFIDQCRCPECDPQCINARNRKLMSKYALDQPCPGCDSGCVIAGVCDCQFLTNEEIKQSTKPLKWPTANGVVNPNCAICTKSKVPPSVRARCLTCGKVFSYDPSFPFNRNGAPALLQLIRQFERSDTDNLAVRDFNQICRQHRMMFRFIGDLALPELLPYLSAMKHLLQLPTNVGNELRSKLQNWLIQHQLFTETSGYYALTQNVACLLME